MPLAFAGRRLPTSSRLKRRRQSGLPEGRETVRVVGAQKRPERVMAPPKAVRPHPWAATSTAHCSIFIDSKLSGELDASAVEGGRGRREVLGLLLGDALRAPGSGARYTVAMAQATAPVKASATHVRF